MRILAILDPLDSLNPDTETTTLLLGELARRGHPAWAAGVEDLWIGTAGPGVRARELVLSPTGLPRFVDAAAEDRPFEDFGLVLMRKDPPVDAAYVFATHVLEAASEQTVIVNDPVSLRNCNEKLLPLRFPDLSPPTVVSGEARVLLEFCRRRERVVLKPLSDCSGRGIRIVPGAEAAAAVAALQAERPGEALLAQAFLPGVEAGDKRIFLLAGEPIGAVNRVPRGPEQLANIHQGARVEATGITSREREMAARLRPFLVERGLWLAGIDVIDGWLTEVNVTSPSAVRQINAVSGSRLEVEIVDLLLDLAARGSEAARSR